MSTRKQTKNQPNDNGEIRKRFSISQKEKDDIQEIQMGQQLLSIFERGLSALAFIQVKATKSRLGVSDAAPEGFTRSFDFDPVSYELIVVDTPVAKSPTETN